MYNLDRFFESFLDRTAFKGMSIVNDYPELGHLITYYKEKISSTKNDLRYLELEHELFSKDIHFPHCGGGYSITWDINRAYEHIYLLLREGHTAITEVDAQTLLPFTNKNEIDRDYLPTALKNEKPVIVIDYPPTNDRIVIDGNHRVIANYEKNPQTMIKAFGLPGYFQLNFMPNDLFRKLYVVHQNLHAVANYMLGNLTEKQLTSENGLVHGTFDLEWMNHYFHYHDGVKIGK